MKNTKKEKPYTMTRKEAFAALRLALRMMYDGLEFAQDKSVMAVKYRSVLGHNAVKVTIDYDYLNERELDETLCHVSNEIARDCHPAIERYRLYE